MNKIVLVDGNVSKINLDYNIDFSVNNDTGLASVNNIKIRVLGNTDLEIEYQNNDESKLDIFIYVEEDVHFSLFEKRIGSSNKIQYKYYLKQNSDVLVQKIYDCTNVKELDLIHLDGMNAKINYLFKTISKGKEDYKVMVYHNYDKTECNIKNHGVNINNGVLLFNVTNVVPNNKVDCVINQVGRIINLTDNECAINPNLLIEENDVIANHSAAIGKFSDEEIFYLMSRGISYDETINLLTKGFLLDELNLSNKKLEEIKKIIDSYWR